MSSKHMPIVLVVHHLDAFELLFSMDYKIWDSHVLI